MVQKIIAIAGTACQMISSPKAAWDFFALQWKQWYLWVRCVREPEYCLCFFSYFWITRSSGPASARNMKIQAWFLKRCILVG